MKTIKHFNSEKEATKYWRKVSRPGLVRNELMYNKDGTFTVITEFKNDK